MSDDHNIEQKLLKDLQVCSQRSLDVLKEREEQLRLALQCADEHVWELNLVTGEIVSSQNVEMVLGYDPVESTEKLDWWRHNVHPDNVKDLDLALNDYLTGKIDRFEIEYRIKDSSGTWRWFWARGKSIEWDTEGRPVRIMGTQLEMTQRKRAEAEFKKSIQELEEQIEHANNELDRIHSRLKASEKDREIAERQAQILTALKQLIDESREFVFMLDDSGTLTFVNDYGAAFMSKDPPEIIGKKVNDIFPPDACAFQMDKVMKVFKTGRGDIVQDNLTFADRNVYLETRLIPVREDGKTVSVLGMAHDITHQKMLEEELWITRFSMDRASDAIFLMGPDANIIYVNEAACQKLGYNKDELLRMRLFDIDTAFSEEDWSSYWENLKKLGSITLESTCRTKDGREFSVEVIANSLEYAGKEFNCAFARDISWRKDMEMELIQSERRYRGIVEDQTELVCRFTRSGTLTFINKAYSDYFEMSRDELMGMRFMNLVHPDDREMLTDKIMALGASSPTVSTEHRVILPSSGEVRWLQWMNRAIYDDRDEFAEYQAVGRDITRRKQEEIALAESERRFRELAEQLPEIVFETDLKGNFTYVNKHALEVTGFSQGDVYGGLNCIDTIVPEDRKRAAENFELIMKGLRREGSEYSMLRKDGQRFPVVIYSSPIYRDGRPSGLRGIVTDITKIRLAQEEKDKLLNELKDALSNVKVLSGLLPICTSCKKIRDEDGYWKKLEGFLAEHFDSSFSYHACPECAARLYADGTAKEKKIRLLTAREKEVLKWIRQGKSNWEIASILGISERTVKYHVSGILQKLDVVTRAQAVAVALELGIIED